MNFTTQVLTSMKDFGLHGLATDKNTVDLLLQSLVAAHKYVVPEPRAITTRITGNSAKFIKLPFPEVVFEYTVSDATASVAIPGINRDLAASTRRAVLVIDLEQSKSFAATFFSLLMTNQGPRIPTLDLVIVSFYYIDNLKRWAPSLGFAMWGTVFADDLNINGIDQAARYGVEVLLPDMIRGCIAEDLLDPEKVIDTMRNDLHEDVCHVLRMLALINARNLNTVQVAPFFAYHTLDIFITGEGANRRRKLPSMADINKMFSIGNKALHEVSGHFKVRKSGIFWWRTFIRGNKDIGVIQSTHKVQEESNANHSN